MAELSMSVTVDRDITDMDYHIGDQAHLQSFGSKLLAEYYNQPLPYELEEKRPAINTRAAEYRQLISELSPLEESQSALIVSYADIPPLNRLSPELLNEFKMMEDFFVKTQSMDERWVLGSEVRDSAVVPPFTLTNITDIYYATRQESFGGMMYKIVGRLRDRRRPTGEQEYDPCMDVYFYLSCVSARGALFLSTNWSSMVYFGIDSDFIRDGCETGNWTFDVEHNATAAAHKYTHLISLRVDDDDREYEHSVSAFHGDLFAITDDERDESDFEREQ